MNNCSLNGWVNTRLGEEDSLRFVKHEGGCTAIFRIDPKTPQINDGWRAEIEDPLRLPMGSNVTYEFSTFIPSALKNIERPNLVLAQWHDNKPRGKQVQRPPFSIRLKDEKIIMPMFNQRIVNEQGLRGPGVPLYSFSASYDRWIQWKIKAHWAADSTGSIEVWVDGTRVANYRGATAYPHDLTAPYFKMGIYTTEPLNRPLEVMHTNYRRIYSTPGSDKYRRTYSSPHTVESHH